MLFIKGIEPWVKYSERLSLAPNFWRDSTCEYFFCVHFVSLWISFTFILILILPNVDLILTLSERRNVVTWLLIYMVVKCLNFSIFSQIFVVKLYNKDFRTYSGFIAFDRNFQNDKHELYETERKALWLWRLCGITEGNIKGILC